MKIYMPSDFRDAFQTDIWVLEQMLALPDNPPVENTSIYDEATGITNHYVHFVSDICMQARQDAVRQYRSALSPVFFTLVQKVYAELFRVFLGQNNLAVVGKRFPEGSQFDIEKKVNTALISSNTAASVAFLPLFQDKTEFSDWWQGQYHYEKFRQARNQIMHNKYTMDNKLLKVEDDKGRELLNLDVNAILLFAQNVVGKAHLVCSIASSP